MGFARAMRRFQSLIALGKLGYSTVPEGITVFLGITMIPSRMQ